MPWKSHVVGSSATKALLTGRNTVTGRQVSPPARARRSSQLPALCSAPTVSACCVPARASRVVQAAEAVTVRARRSSSNSPLM